MKTRIQEVIKTGGDDASIFLKIIPEIARLD